MIYSIYTGVILCRAAAGFSRSLSPALGVERACWNLTRNFDSKRCHDATVCVGAELTQSTAQQSLQPGRAEKQSCKNNQFSFCPCVQMEVDPIGHVGAARIANV